MNAMHWIAKRLEDLLVYSVLAGIWLLFAAGFAQFFYLISHNWTLSICLAIGALIGLACER